MNIGDRVRHFRKATGLSGKTLAERVDLDPSQIYKIESNATKPSFDALERICNVLNVTLSEFFSDGQKPEYIPADIRNFVSEKENQDLIRLILDLIEFGYSREVISEWVTTLGHSLNSIRVKYGVRWADEDLIPEEHKGKFTEREKQEIVDGLKKKLHDKNFKPPWKNGDH